MTSKKVLLALVATGLLAFGAAAPVYAEDPPPPADEGAVMDVPADPDSADQGDAMPDPGTDEGAAGDQADNPDGGSPPDGGEPQPQ